MIAHYKDFARGLLKKIMKINLHFHRLSLVFAIVLGFISLTSYTKSVVADSSIKSIYAELIQAQSTRDKSIDFSGTGRPNEQTAAGSRGSCEGINDKELIALVPENEGRTLTIAEYPTFWVYIPYEAKNIRYAELVLQNESKNQEVNRISYKLQETPGIVSIDVPQKPEHSLETSTIDRWYFRVVCNNENRYAVGGFIKRVTVDSIEHNYDSYLDNHIWYDALNDLAERLRLAPQDLNLKQDWHDLMKANEVGLEQLAEEFKFGYVVPKTEVSD